MGTGRWLLLAVVAAGLLGRNPLVTTAALLVLLLGLVATDGFWKILEEQGVRFGLLLLLLGVLAPFGSGELTWQAIRSSLTRLDGLVALATGLVSAWLGARGLALLERAPELMVGFVAGSVLGVTFFSGIPAGPLVAFGLAALVLEALKP